jgi:hypothetical protein
MPSPTFDPGVTAAHAQCLCGAVQLDAQLPSLWTSHCHCQRCRRAHGAAFVTWIGLDAARCAVRDPQCLLRWHHADDSHAARGFCMHCGSTLFFKSPRWPGELHAVVANFTTPLDRAPQAHTHWETHVDWCAVDPDDGLPRHTSEPADEA